MITKRSLQWEIKCLWEHRWRHCLSHCKLRCNQRSVLKAASFHLPSNLLEPELDQHQAICLERPSASTCQSILLPEHSSAGIMKLAWTGKVLHWSRLKCSCEIFRCGEKERQTSEILKNVRTPIALWPQCIIGWSVEWLAIECKSSTSLFQSSFWNANTFDLIFGSTLPLGYIKQKDFFPFNVTSRNILPFSRPAWTVRRENIAQAVEEALLNLSARWSIWTFVSILWHFGSLLLKFEAKRTFLNQSVQIQLSTK